MDKTPLAAFGVIKWVMKLVILTKDYDLQIVSKHQKAESMKWNMVIYTDSNWELGCYSR